METQEKLNYRRIAKAIDYIRCNFRKQPGLDEIADYVGLSPAHFQRMFTDRAGISPKHFLKYVSMQHARPALVSIEGMTSAEYQTGGQNLRINYEQEDTAFGPVLIASTDKGVCYLAFTGGKAAEAKELLIRQFPEAAFMQQTDSLQQQALSIFAADWTQLPTVKLHLRGTPFQLKVWACLLRIPRGETMTYGGVAGQIGAAGASRAVGTAIGSNPVAFLIPCHRVIRGDGGIGGYRWGPTRKQLLLAWEDIVTNDAGQEFPSSLNKRS